MYLGHNHGFLAYSASMEGRSKDAIEAAQKAAEAQRITGKAVTPFLLAKILELTGGRSLKTNIALVENNARLAARIAKAL
jgi:pseudouridine-5'-phosphate glycosidase